MPLRLMIAIAGERARRSFACVLVLVILAATRAEPALAQDSEDAYSATVKVDATADSAAAARDAARLDGQRRALAAVVGRLSGASEPAQLPKLDDKAITDMVQSFEVANERMSTVRYVADYTFHFRSAKVRRLVRVADTTPVEGTGKSTAEGTGKSTAEGTGKSTAEGAGKTTAESGSKSIVVLPVFKNGASLTLWNDPNAWRGAWAQRSAASGPTHLLLPLGDAGDLAAIDADQAGSGDATGLAAIAKQNGGSEAVVALATARRQDGRLVGVEVSVKHYRAGRLVDAHGNSYDANPGEGEADILRRTADAVAADIESSVKKDTASSFDRQVSLTISVPITSLGEWLQVRNRLASVASIRKVDLLSLSRQEAKIAVKYIGDQDQLKSRLAEVDLELAGGDPVWRIQPSHVASPH
jgi:hypothetical protein